jgi:hypothetical protein
VETFSTVDVTDVAHGAHCGDSGKSTWREQDEDLAEDLEFRTCGEYTFIRE